MEKTTSSTRIEPRINAEGLEILTQANAGNRPVIPQLQEVLARHPELIRQYGDLAANVRESLLEIASGSSLVAREAIDQRMTQLSLELGGSGGSKLEEMLIERVVLTWAIMHLAEFDSINARSNGVEKGIIAERRLTAAQNRYQSAVKQLVVVRKLLKPALSPLEMLSKPVNETAAPNLSRRSSMLRLHEAVTSN